jgi:zinc transport system ATP-binding protein
VSEVVVECRGVSVRYGSLQVLEDISFDLPACETLCLVGPNGGGKSTLLKSLLGLVPLEQGSIRVLGKTPASARLEVGYMPQYIDIDPLFPIDVEGIVRMGRLRRWALGGYSSEDRAATRKVLQELDLWEYRREPFRNLSGGMKQRVLIARALVNEPRLLLLDEPTAMVDAHVEAKLLRHLKELHDTMTIILVSHDAQFVSGLVDEVLCINRTADMHPLQEVQDKSVEALYGEPVKAVLHDQHSGTCGGSHSPCQGGRP